MNERQDDLNRYSSVRDFTSNGKTTSRLCERKVPSRTFTSYFQIDFQIITDILPAPETSKEIVSYNTGAKRSSVSLIYPCRVCNNEDYHFENTEDNHP